MYFGETPWAMNELRVGVKPFSRKSARNPSRDIRIVVAANFEVPLERMDSGCLALKEELNDCLYAPMTRMPSTITITEGMMT